MKQINIFQLIRPSNGGIREHVKCLLNNLNPSKFKHYIVSDGNTICNIEHHLKKNVNTIFIPIELKGKRNYLSDMKVLLQIWTPLKKDKFHIVHCHGLKAAFFGSIISKILGVSNLIYTAHSEVPFRESQKKEVFFYKSAEKTASYYSKRIIAVSHGIKNGMLARNIPPEKITVIQNGIDVNRFGVSIDKKLKRRQMGIPDNTKIVGTIGRLAPQKDIEVLLKTASILLEINPKLHFLIIGDGPLKQQLQIKAIKLGIEKHVTFSGYRDDIPEILQLIDVFTLTSWTEGFPITALEAMASEKPVVATKVGGTSEIIEDGRTGLFVKENDEKDLAEKISFILNDKNYGINLGKTARKDIMSKYTADRMVKSIERLYYDVINKGGIQNE